MHCPALTHIEYYPLTPFPIDLEVQTLKTADGHELTINASIMVTISDPLLLRDSIGYDEYVSNISMEARNAIQSFVSGHNQDHGMSILDRLEGSLGDSLYFLAEGGIDLNRLCIEDAASTTAFRVYGLSQAF